MQPNSPPSAREMRGPLQSAAEVGVGRGGVRAVVGASASQAASAGPTRRRGGAFSERTRRQKDRGLRSPSRRESASFRSRQEERCLSQCHSPHMWRGRIRLLTPPFPDFMIPPWSTARREGRPRRGRLELAHSTCMLRRVRSSTRARMAVVPATLRTVRRANLPPCPLKPPRRTWQVYTRPHDYDRRRRHAHRSRI